MRDGPRTRRRDRSGLRRDPGSGSRYARPETGTGVWFEAGALEVAALELGCPAPSDNPYDALVLDAAVLDQLVADTDAGFIGTVISTFVVDAARRTARVRAAVSRQDIAAIEREAHALGSAAATFGACRLAAMARSIEESCRTGDADRALALAVELDPLVRETRAALGGSADEHAD